MFNRKGAQPTITLDSDNLEVVKEHKYLGVWLDEKLNWKTHKAYVLAKAKKRAYTILGFRVNKLLPVKTCVTLWEVLVRPILEYAEERFGVKVCGKRQKNSIAKLPRPSSVLQLELRMRLSWVT